MVWYVSKRSRRGIQVEIKVHKSRKPPKHLVRSKEREEADTGGHDLEFLFEVQLDCESKRPYDTPGIDTLLESYTLESDFPAGYTKDVPPQTEEHTGEWFAYRSEI